MSGIRCDVTFLPCDGHYTMGPEDAAAAGRAVETSVVVPVRWGQTGARNEGGGKDVERLAELFPGRVEILPRKS